MAKYIDWNKPEITIDGVTRSRNEWLEIKNLKRPCVLKRMQKRGLTFREALDCEPMSTAPHEHAAHYEGRVMRHPVTIDGETHTVHEWLDILGLPLSTFQVRIYQSARTYYDALVIPKHQKLPKLKPYVTKSKAFGNMCEECPFDECILRPAYCWEKRTEHGTLNKRVIVREDKNGHSENQSG